jgi:hypothetical protein
MVCLNGSKLALSGWKGRKHTFDYNIHFWRNYVNIKFCPVFWLMLWIRVSGIKAGPIYCRLQQDGKSIMKCTKTAILESNTGPSQTVYLDDKDNVVNLHYHHLSRVFKVIFKNARLPPETSLYIFRKTGAKWAARCGAKEWQIKNTGRWYRTSRHFHSYIEAGVYESELKSMDAQIDIIRTFWVYKPTCFLTRLADEFNT